MFALIATAFATSFTFAESPAVMDFEYDYPSFGVTGDTEFTFTAIVPDTSTDICSLSGLCMDGSFVTADGGEGPFVTDAFVDNCTPSPPPPPPQMMIEVVPRVCDVTQTMDLIYVYNGGSLGPNYLGDAPAGQLSEFEVYLCFGGSCMSFGFFGQTFLADPMEYAGDIEFGGLGIVGTFLEL